MSQVVQTTKAKAVVAALGTLLTVLATVFADDVLDTSELGSLIAGAVTAAATIYGVYRTPNEPKQ